MSIAVIPTQIKAKEDGEPQMAWLSYAEGQVKFSPEHNWQARLGKEWIEASRGQVMEDGYTLVTEKGRTEIEFENGAVVYLAENSVLEFDRLWSGSTSMETRLNLIAGTLTVAHPAGGEVQLFTPVMRMRLIEAQTTRVECVLDGVVINHAAHFEMPNSISSRDSSRATSLRLLFFLRSSAQKLVDDSRLDAPHLVCTCMAFMNCLFRLDVPALSRAQEGPRASLFVALEAKPD